MLVLAGVESRYPGSEQGLEAVDELGGERNFGNQV